jgi:DeoR family fructose operon transcriptional repressor
MLASERRMLIEQKLDQKKVLTIREIAADLDVSESTVRRDMDELEKAGVVVRVYGGVMRPKRQSTMTDTMELSMLEKSVINNEAKRTLCLEASGLVKNGNCVFVDGGTSLMYMFEFLAGRDVKIVTHSNLFPQYIHDLRAELFIVGGKFVPKYGMNVGPMTSTILQKLHFDHAFIGCAGIDLVEMKATTADIESAMIKQLAIKNSICKYLIADASKVNVRGFYDFEELDSFDAIFIDGRPEGAERLDNIIVCE